MTLLIGSLSHSRGALLACDRLINRGGTPFDALASKAVVYRAADAVVVLAYTGLAYLHAGTTTDQYIAELLVRGRLTSPVPGEPPSMVAIHGPSARPIMLHAALEHLRAEIAARFAVSTFPSASLKHSFEIIVLGWRRTPSDEVRPLAAYIGKRPGERDVQLYWYPRQLTRSGMVISAPRQMANRLDMDQVADDLQTATGYREEERVLVKAIRRVAITDPGYVGHDCTIVRIHVGKSPQVIVRSDLINPVTIEDDTSRLPEQLRATFGSHARLVPIDADPSTWLVSHNFVHYPSRLVGSWSSHLDGIEVLLEGPSMEGPGLQAAMHGITRPPAPSR